MRQIFIFLFLLIFSGVQSNAQVLVQNFDGGSFPPAGWFTYHTLNGTPSAPLWTTSTSAYSGTHAAFLSWQPTPSGLKRDYLISPLFTPTLTNHIISFWHTTGFPGNDGTELRIGASTASSQLNAVSSNTLLSIYADYQMPWISQGYINHTINLTAYIGQPIYLVFDVTQFNNGDNWYIDNITTQTSTTCTLNTTLNQSICQGGSLLFNGQNLTTAGTYYDTLTSVVGCDSIITLNLNVNQIVSNISQTICQGGSFLFNGQNLSTAGIYYDTLSTAAGCDSLIVLNLNVNQLRGTINHSLCEGESVVFNGQTIYTAGVFVDTFVNAQGCDSIVTFYVSQKPSVSVTTSIPVTDVCKGGSVHLNANVATTNNYSYYFNGTNNLINAGYINEFSGANQFTLEAMVMSNSNNFYRTILAKRSGWDGFSLQFDQTVVNNGLVFFMGTGSGYCMGYTATNSFTTGAWNHVAAVFDGTQASNADKLKIYVNGVQQPLTFVFGGTASAVPTSSSLTPALPFVIGCESFAPASNICFSGFLDDVRLWDVARSASQIASSNNSCLNFQDNVGLVAEYNMNEGGNPASISNNARPVYPATLVNANFNFSSNMSGCNLAVPGNTLAFTGGLPNGSYVYPTDTTLYIASLSSANGCVDTASILVNVLRSPLDSVSVSSNYACSGSGFRLNAYTTGLYNYLYWKDPADNLIAYNSPLDITPAVPGWYSATCGGTNGCSSIDSILVLPDNGNQSAVSVPGQSDATLNQADGSTIRYTDENCNSIATIQDAPGGNSLGEVTATVNNLPSAGTYNGESYVRKVYTITPTNQGPANVILYFSQADFNDYNANNGSAPDLPTGPGDAAGIANVRVTKVSGGALGIGTSSLIVPTSVIWNATHSTWAVAFAVSSFSEFYLHSANPSNGALPVELVSFTGKTLGAINSIQWMTASEINNAGFELYRSNDGKTFAQMAKLATKALNGQSALPLQYEWVDAQPKPGHNYYKLKQMDIDGRTTESEVIDVYRSTDGSMVRVYPNPASAQIYLEWDSRKEESIEIQLLDMSGRIVQQIVVMAREGMNTQVLNVESLSPGLYTLQRIQNKQVISIHKVKKQ